MKFRFHSDFRYWEICLAALAARTEAERAAIWAHWTAPDPRMHGPVQCGYYKRKLGGRWVPVLILKESGGLTIRTGTASARQLTDDKVWEWCEPIAYEAYVHAFEHGRFPGEIDEPPPAADHNAADPGAEFRDDMIALAGRIEAFIESCPQPLTEETANSLANYLDMLRLAEKTAAEICKSEIAEAQAKIRQRRELWDAPTRLVADVAASIKALITPYLRQRRLEGAEIKVGGQRGKRVSLKSRWSARIEDWPTVIAEFQNHPRVRELIQSLLDANARSKDRAELAVEGAVYFEEEVAV